MWLEASYAVFSLARTIEISQNRLAELSPVLRHFWGSVSQSGRLRWNHLLAAIQTVQRAQTANGSARDILAVFVGKDPAGSDASESSEDEEDAEKSTGDRDQAHSMDVDEEEDDSSDSDAIEVSNVVPASQTPVVQPSKAKKSKRSKEKPKTQAAKDKTFDPSIHKMRLNSVSLSLDVRHLS
jgi:hypothetical protein